MTRTVTTTQQFKIMVSFMEQCDDYNVSENYRTKSFGEEKEFEKNIQKLHGLLDMSPFRHGDLTHPCHGIRAKLSRNRLWHQLAATLNSGPGDPRPVERWKKVWSDCKNNIKKKVFRLRRSSATAGELGESGGLTELERRVIKVLKDSGGFTEPRGHPSDSSDNSTGNPLADMPWEIPTANAEITMTNTAMKLEDDTATNATEPALEFVSAIPTSPHPPAFTEPSPQRKNLPPPGPLRRVRFRLENPTDRTLEYLTNSDRERRNEQRQRDEEERRYRRESDIRREAMERRWQNLFERFLNVVEKLIE